MEAKIIRSYLSNVPAVICTAGSYIASKNTEARQKLGWLFEGGRLFERMNPESVLKYEAHFASCRVGDAFSFTVNTTDGLWYAVARFDSICTRRFAEVLFFKGRDEMERELEKESSEPTNEEKVEFASILLGISEESFEPTDKKGLIDLKTSTAHLISKISEMGISASFCENEEAGCAICIPEDIPMVSYLQMVMMMVLSIAGACRTASVFLKICKYGKNAEVAVGADTFDFVGIQSCDDLSRAFPSVAAYISLCSYIAGIYGCTLEVRNDSDVGCLSLVLVIGERPLFDVDFKSRDPLLYFDESFEFSKKYIMSLVSGDAQ